MDAVQASFVMTRRFESPSFLFLSVFSSSLFISLSHSFLILAVGSISYKSGNRGFSILIIRRTLMFYIDLSIYLSN